MASVVVEGVKVNRRCCARGSWRSGRVVLCSGDRVRDPANRWRRPCRGATRSFVALGRKEMSQTDTDEELMPGSVAGWAGISVDSRGIRVVAEAEAPIEDVAGPRVVETSDGSAARCHTAAPRSPPRTPRRRSDRRHRGNQAAARRATGRRHRSAPESTSECRNAAYRSTITGQVSWSHVVHAPRASDAAEVGELDDPSQRHLELGVGAEPQPPTRTAGRARGWRRMLR